MTMNRYIQRLSDDGWQVKVGTVKWRKLDSF